MRKERREVKHTDTPSVLVTGASSGIGEACALCLHKRGFRVFAGVRKAEAGEALRAKASERLVPVIIDVTKPEQIAEAAETVARNVGEAGLQGLVNNAGIALAGPLEYLPPEQLRRQLDVNVVGQMAVTQAFLPLLRAGQGRVVNMGSTSGFLALPFLGPYAASKYALEALTDALRVELRPWRIPVVIIQPGMIKTPIWDKSREMAETIAAGLPAQAEERYKAPLDKLREQAEAAPRMASPPERVARCVAHALTARRPRLRYRVGKTAHLQYILAHFVPARLRDTLFGLSLLF